MTEFTNNLNFTGQFKSLFFDRLKNVKHKLKNVLMTERYCGLCMEYHEDLLTVEMLFEINTLYQKISIRNMIKHLFSCESILTSNYVCCSCVDQLTNSYLFIAATKFVADVINIYLASLLDKVYACNLDKVKRLDNSKLVLCLDSTEVEEYFPEKFKITKGKSEEKKERNTYECLDCDEIISNYKDFTHHKKLHMKSKFECNICGKVLKNDDSLSVHYSVHKVIKCKVCKELIKEKDLNNHLKKKHKDETVECQVCDIVLYNDRALETHVNVCHKRDEHIQCPLCLKHFENNDKESHKCRFSCSQCKIINCRHFEYLMSYRNQKLQGKKVKCIHCDYVTNKRESYLGHINRIHLKYLPYKCNQCTLRFNSKINLQTHIQRIHKDNKYVCGYCDKQFNDKGDLELHIKYCQFINRDYPCKSCTASFNTYDEISKHTFKHSGLYQCQICNKEFLFESRLKRHIDIAHFVKTSNVRNNKCSMSPLKNNKLEQPCICETCGKSFSKKESLKAHLKIHEDKVPCPECKKVYLPRKLNVHRKIHLAETDPTIKENLKKRSKVKCSFCDYVTYDNISLEGHINRYHKKIKPYNCTVCHKEFLGKLHLKRHMQCHSKGKSRKCDLCPKVLANKDCFRMHMRIHTGERPYTCNICGEKFRSSSIMNVHKNRMHGEKSFKCPLCSSMFYSIGELRNHCRKVHWKHKDKKFNYKELEGLKEEHYYLFYDGRMPNIKSKMTK